MKIILYLIVFFTFINSSLSRIKDISTLSTYLAGSNAGTEFYFSFPACYDEESPGSDNYLRVFVASGVRQEITVEVESQGWRESKIAEANDVVEFKIPTTVGQPFYKRGRDKAPPEQVYSKAAVHVKAHAPIICYGVTRYQYTSDGFLAIPISAFGNEYVIASYPQYTAAGFGYFLPAESNIVAAYDWTEVTFTMGGIAGSMTTGGLKKGKKATFNMMKGDVLCFANDGDAQDIAGSLVKSTKPIGVVSGNQCANVPSGVYACDYISEMELPTFTWGKEYHVTPIVGRLKAPVIRVFAKEPNTKVFLDGKFWFDLSLQSRGEGDAFIERRSFDGLLADVVKTGGTPCKVISADKPIYIMLYNPGQTDDNVTSDPFSMVMTPLEQYQKEIVFCTPGAKGGTLPFLRQYVNLVYENAPDGSIPDDLEFATVVNGKFSWKKVNVQFGANPGYKFSIPIRGKTYSMKRLQLNEDGLYRIRANSPFAGYVYGFSWYDSYGFPTSAGLGDLEKKDTIKPDPKWKVLCDGSVVGADGSGSALVTDKLDNPNRGLSLDLIYMDLDSSYNYDFNYERIGTMIDGSHDSVKWSLNVVNPKLEAKAKIIFVDRAGNDTTIQVSYYPFDVAITGLNSTIQKANIGKEYIDEIYMVNKRNTPTIVKNIAFTKVGSGFSIDNTQFPLTIAASDSVKLVIKFKSLKQGRFIDTLVIDNGCLPIPIVKGIVVADVVLTNISTNDIDFGEIEIGKKINLPFLVQNRGESNLTITGYSLPKDSTIFKTINFPEISSQNPLVLTPGEIKLFNVEFSPLDMITYSDSINFTCDANNVDSIVKLMGKGKIVSSTNETDIIGENDITIVEEGRVLQFIFNNFKDESLSISLFDLLGNVITSQYIPNPFYGFTYSINGNGLANGVYIAIVKQGSRNYVKRLIIK